MGHLAGDDTFRGSPVDGILSGDGFFNRVKGFAAVTAHASEGHDVADLEGSAGNDLLVTGQGFGSLAGPESMRHKVPRAATTS